MILSIDYGDKRIGLAIGDPESKSIKPIGYIQNKYYKIPQIKRAKSSIKNQFLSNVILNLLEIIKKYNCTNIVVGIPLNIDQSDTLQSKKIKVFLKKLEEKLKYLSLDIPIHTIEESVSSHIARERLVSEGYTQKKINSLIDTYSAVVILESFI